MIRDLILQFRYSYLTVIWKHVRKAPNLWAVVRLTTSYRTVSHYILFIAEGKKFYAQYLILTFHNSSGLSTATNLDDYSREILHD